MVYARVLTPELLANLLLRTFHLILRQVGGDYVAPFPSSLCLLGLFCVRTNESHDASSPTATTAPLQVIYVVGTNSIDTYNIDPQSLYPTQVGTLSINNPSYYYWLLPSPDDHFIYFGNVDSQLKWHLYIYRTNALGAPQAPATQALSPGSRYFSLQLAPRTNYAYAVFGNPGDVLNDMYYLRRYVVDPTTGQISQPQLQAKYVLPNGAGGSEGCSFRITGFTPVGNKMYDEVDCWFHGGDSTSYYERNLDRQTGQLGADLEVTAWANTSGGGTRIQFIGNHMFAFVSPNDWQQGVNTVGIYPIVANTSIPLLLCDAQMLQSCGYGGGIAHPSGKYVFMQMGEGMTQVDKVELSNRRIVDTGNYVPGSAYVFSPDGLLVYGTSWTSSGYLVDIYGFNLDTSEVRTGGSIFVPGFAGFFAAERY